MFMNNINFAKVVVSHHSASNGWLVLLMVFYGFNSNVKPLNLSREGCNLMVSTNVVSLSYA